ncbi:MAG: DUF3990 domain-containing protein [Ruminococcus flavefaciens]|nr:DUF3990 domain-containing protein [Ruminococcus flavefaciens]
MKDIILYHGSKSGIVGDIRPESRETCDFGKGFYMGTEPMQAKSLVTRFDNPQIYTVRLRLSEIPESKILRLDDDREWLYTILACRGAMSAKNIPSARKLLADLKKYDVIIGKIADDSMKEALSAFYENSLTDEGLTVCLQKADYGLQYVAKTEFACSKIDILSEKRLFGREKQDAISYGITTRNRCIGIVEKMQTEFSDRGEYMHDIIQRETKKGKGRG